MARPVQGGVWPAPPKSEFMRVGEGWLNKGILFLGEASQEPEQGDRPTEICFYPVRLTKYKKQINKITCNFMIIS